ncbi:MAG: hypothetical protein R6V04_14245 [bacterium]
MNIHEISLEKILKDEEFRFTSSDYSQILKKSISDMGIINPVYLIFRGTSYQILAGFKRVSCALALGQKIIPARIVKKKRIAECFRNLILEHLSYHTLNIIEKAKIIQIFNKLGIDWEQGKKYYLRIIDIPEKINVAEKMLRLLELPKQVQDYIEAYDISLKQTEIFHNFNEEGNIFFVNLAAELGIRSVELAKLMTLTEDIAGKESVIISDIFNDINIDDVLKNDKLSKNQKTKEITQRLQYRRYGKLKRWNDQLEQLRKRLDTPDFMQISWDTSLERPGVSINNHITSMQDIGTLANYFSQPIVKNNFKQMLDIV